MKCNKVKNPCKICFQTVTKKTGLQCQGACQKWAHYKCLNYTPGKIQDIKSGVIKITCPCPDCSTSLPKEVLADPPFSCTNTQCPANKLPVCTSVECPTNTENPIPTYPAPPSKCGPKQSLQNCELPSCPLGNTSSTNCPSPRRTRSPPRSPPKRKSSPRCPKKVKNTCSPPQSISCSDMSPGSSVAKPCDKKRRISSDTRLSASSEQRSIYSCIENLCNTVGQLSNQLKELICKLKVEQ